MQAQICRREYGRLGADNEGHGRPMVFAEYLGHRQICQGTKRRSIRNGVFAHLV
jgi:hypothetical protein